MAYTLAQKKRYARKLKRNQTAAEKAMCYLWLFGFRAQRITPAGYIADWYNPFMGVIVELDGAPHKTRTGRVNDKRRDKHHRARRVLTIRLNNSTALNHRVYSYSKVLCVSLLWQLVQWFGVSG